MLLPAAVVAEHQHHQHVESSRTSKRCRTYSSPEFVFIRVYGIGLFLKHSTSSLLCCRLIAPPRKRALDVKRCEKVALKLEKVKPCLVEQH